LMTRIEYSFRGVFREWCGADSLSIESAISGGCRSYAIRPADHAREAATATHACERGAVAGPTPSINKKKVITPKSKNQIKFRLYH
jgi:hypothetical protein